jgi:hypothetical protein
MALDIVTPPEFFGCLRRKLIGGAPPRQPKNRSFARLRGLYCIFATDALQDKTQRIG